MARCDSKQAAALAVVVMLLSMSDTAALDCSKAAARLEHAICGNPSAAASDLVMAVAFDDLRARVMRAGRQDDRDAALIDQRVWLRQRNDQCGRLGSSATRARCAEEQNLARTRVLTGRPDAGPGLLRQPVPLFVRRDAGADRFEMIVRIYRFGSPQSAGEHLVNARADDALRSEPSGLQEGARVADLKYKEDWTLSYGSPRLLSIRIDQWEYNGGAHGWGSTKGLNVDWESGAELTLPAVFDAPALKQLAKFCIEAIGKDRAQRGTGDDFLHRREKIDAIFSDARNWIFGETGAVIEFGRLDGYAIGPYSCVLPFSMLDQLAKRPYR